ncbi:hypothetical protein HYT18_02270 [Candidatus Microgenomates bacterium]|nr:hypothetical protein [Candidatus Microgenomates bacterium]
MSVIEIDLVPKIALPEIPTKLNNNIFPAPTLSTTLRAILAMASIYGVSTLFAKSPSVEADPNIPARAVLHEEACATWTQRYPGNIKVRNGGWFNQLYVLDPNGDGRAKIWRSPDFNDLNVTEFNVTDDVLLEDCGVELGAVTSALEISYSKDVAEYFAKGRGETYRRL